MVEIYKGFAVTWFLHVHVSSGFEVIIWYSPGKTIFKIEQIKGSVSN